MEYLALLFTLTTLAVSIGIFFQLTEIRKETKIIMANQEEFDRQMAAVNAALDAVGSSIKSEAQEVKDFIAANVGVDTSALDGVVTRLEGVAVSVNDIFTPPIVTPAAESPAEEAAETPAEESAETPASSI